MQKEVKNYIYLCEKIKNNNFQETVKSSFEFYIKNAKFYKYIGMILSVLGIEIWSVAVAMPHILWWQIKV